MPRRRRARASARSSVSAAPSSPASRTIQSSERLEVVLVDERAQQRVVLEAAQEAGRADHLLGAVQRRLDAEALAGARERLVPARPGGYEGASSVRRIAARSAGAVRWKPSSARRENHSRGTFSGAAPVRCAEPR